MLKLLYLSKQNPTVRKRLFGGIWQVGLVHSIAIGWGTYMCGIIPEAGYLVDYLFLAFGLLRFLANATVLFRGKFQG